MTFARTRPGLRSRTGLLCCLGLVVLVCAASSVRASVRPFPSVAFVVTCRATHMLSDDPMKFPGQPGASHLHQFFGNTTTSASSTYESMLGKSTSCNEPDDTASYWTPSPAATYMRAYYDRGAVAANEVKAIPAGAQAIAGSPDVASPGVAVVAFRCGFASDGPDRGSWSPEAPQKCSAGSVYVRYTFGQCMSGQRLVECDNNAKPTYVRVRLLLEWKGAARHKGVVHGPHADFWNTWNQARFERLTQLCVRGEREAIQIKECRLPGTGPA